jgi:hypothetical protein
VVTLHAIMISLGVVRSRVAIIVVLELREAGFAHVALH